MKKISIFMVAVIFMVVSSITTYAAPQVMKDGAIFDAQDYADRYPDLKKVYGYNVDFLYPHYLLIGAEEGRTAIYTPAPQKSNNEKDIKGNKQITKHTPETDGYKMWTWYDMGSYMFRIVDKAEAYSSVVGGEEEQHAAMVAARYPGWKPSFGGAQMLDDGTERFVELVYAYREYPGGNVIGELSKNKEYEYSYDGSKAVYYPWVWK